jgi:hypothetical protein
VEKLQDEERWEEDQSVLGLPKVEHRKSHAGRKAKEAPEKVAVEGVEAAAEATETTTEES